ncbi:hypothetical protein NUACC26_073940 [Scytonema sp. NUACC26]
MNDDCSIIIIKDKLELMPVTGKINTKNLAELMGYKNPVYIRNEFSNSKTIIMTQVQDDQPYVAITRKGRGISGSCAIFSMFQTDDYSIHFYGMSEERIQVTLGELKLVTVCK